MISRRILNIAVLAAAAAALASCHCISISTDKPGTEIDIPDGVRMNAEEIRFDDGPLTRTDVSAGESGLRFTWSESDAVGVYSTQNGFARFGLQSGENTASAYFDGGGFALKKDNTYYAVYPYDGSLTDMNSIPVDYSAQVIHGQNNLADITALDKMTACATALEDGSADFRFTHVGSFAKMTMSMPSGASWSRLDLIPTYDEMTVSYKHNLVNDGRTDEKTTAFLQTSLEGISTSSAGESISFWMSLIPHDFSDKDIAAVFYDSSNRLYTARLKGKNLRRGRAYRWNNDVVAYSDAVPNGFSVTSNTAVSLSSLGISYGQYSGITKVKDNQYAVVHDKSNGGGIHFFNLKFNSNGVVTSASMTTPTGTSSGSSCRDPEGIVYVPSSNSLFVSGESDQSILEYDMDGVATGRKLAIPQDMVKSMIQSNMGFESLAYNANTGLFWTTTEASLKKDKDYLSEKSRKLMRLQSFKSNLKAGDRFLYLMDAPAATSSTYTSYVHGISDMLALDDGRLVIMERELFVYTSSLQAWSKTKLYVVDPVNDKGGILSKSLLTSFDTSLLALANYEGMCLGPSLSSGRSTILLVNDSQGGQSFSIFRLSDYIKTITIK